MLGTATKREVRFTQMCLCRSFILCGLDSGENAKMLPLMSKKWYFFCLPLAPSSGNQVTNVGADLMAVNSSGSRYADIFAFLTDIIMTFKFENFH